MPRIAVAFGVFRLTALLLAGGLSACASSRPVIGPNVAASSRHPGITCAPFARELSGIALYGDADTWWAAAAGRYGRSAQPQIGAVLVMHRSSRLPSGHVAVVSRVLAPRQVLVIQANWVPEEVTEDQLAIDVSPHNDWTEVRMWWPPTDRLGGHTYVAYGFILPPTPTTHDTLRRAARPAAQLAQEAAIGRPPPAARRLGG
jgi:surface antigen